MLKQIAEKMISEYKEFDVRYAGVRTLVEGESYKVDDFVRESYEYDFENDCSTYFTTGERAGGACATDVCPGGNKLTDTLSDGDIDGIVAMLEDAISYNSSYNGYGQVVIVSATCNSDYQMDDREIRLERAWVLAVL